MSRWAVTQIGKPRNGPNRIEISGHQPFFRGGEGERWKDCGDGSNLIVSIPASLPLPLPPPLIKKYKKKKYGHGSTGLRDLHGKPNEQQSKAHATPSLSSRARIPQTLYPSMAGQERILSHLPGVLRGHFVRRVPFSSSSTLNDFHCGNPHSDCLWILYCGNNLDSNIYCHNICCCAFFT